MTHVRLILRILAIVLCLLVSFGLQEKAGFGLLAMAGALYILSTIVPWE